MRSILDIIIAVKENQSVEKEELRLALLSLEGIYYFLSEELNSLIEEIDKGSNENLIKLKVAFAKSTRERMFQARKKDPLSWLGPQNIPGSKEYDERLRMMKNIYKNATGEDL